MTAKADAQLKTVAMLPDWRGGNPYQDLLAHGVATHGWKVTFSDYGEGSFPLQRLLGSQPDTRYLHLHWIAPRIEPIVWSGSAIKFRVKLWLFLADVLICRMRGRRVIWTVHNQVDHESINVEREVFVRGSLAKAVSNLIFHSERARASFRREIADVPDSKSSVIPHGNYIGVYEENAAKTASLAKELGVTTTNTVILFFGLVRRYKGVTDLISAFKKTSGSELRLIIAGRVPDIELQREIEELSASDDRIILRLGFIPEGDVAQLHSLANAVAIPFQRTLTSGSVVLAMSLGRALILPEAARVLDVVDESGAIFFGDSATLSRSIEQLSLESAAIMGQHNLDAARMLDWDGIGLRISSVYEG